MRFHVSARVDTDDRSALALVLERIPLARGGGSALLHPRVSSWKRNGLAGTHGILTGRSCRTYVAP